MRCLSPHQVEELTLINAETVPARVQGHLRRCPACASLLDAARRDAQLIRDLRELRETRARVQPISTELLTSLTGGVDRTRPEA